jgi:hypothetical protein
MSYFKNNIVYGGHLEIQNARQFDTICYIFASTDQKIMLVYRGTIHEVKEFKYLMLKDIVYVFFYGGHI